jgi:signal transduction histidine kinase
MKKDTSIQRRLMRVILITCGATLVLTSVAYFGYEYLNFRKTYLKQLSNTGKIIASNSTAALAFDNPDDANEILSSLKVDPDIVGACLYDNTGKIFAKYPLNAPENIFPIETGVEGYGQKSTSYFEGFQPVVQGSKKLGTLYLRTDMKAMSNLFTYYGIIAIMVLGFSFLFAFFLSRKLQYSISEPILSLAKTAKAISERQDYSVRATKYTNDELGLLTDTFNQMLSQIELQNLKIVSFNQELEQKVSDRTEQLEAANKEMEAFSYSVSHDLRSPLRAVIGYSQILEMDHSDTLNPDALSILKRISSNAQRMGQLIDDLLSFSRLGRQDIKKSDINMHSLVQEVIKEVTQLSPYKANIVMAETLPSAMADRSLIYQVWMNLLSNAVKYSSKKDNPLVEIGATVKDNTTIYFVKDNGAGFNMEYANKLFNVFQRLHSPKEFEGTGIGLATVARIIIKHGGKVWAEAKENEGATFYFILPKEQTINKAT